MRRPLPVQVMNSPWLALWRFAWSAAVFIVVCYWIFQLFRIAAFIVVTLWAIVEVVFILLMCTLNGNIFNKQDWITLRTSLCKR